MAFESASILSELSSTLGGPVGIAFSLTLLGAIAMGSLRQHKQRNRASVVVDSDSPQIPRELKIPVAQNDPDQIECADVINRVNHLATKDNWDILSIEIADWESRLDATSGGKRNHEIAVDTCLTGLRSLLDEAPRDSLSSLDASVREVDRFVERQKASPEEHVFAVIAARAHLMVASSCDAEFWPEAERSAAWRQMAHHYLHAEAILTPFDPMSYMSPLLAGAYYELSYGMPDDAAGRQTAFEDWIDLDPSNPAIYAAHVPSFLTGEEGDIDRLLIEAERADDRTHETLGSGGYALCLLPAIAEDPSLRLQIEPDRFAAGLMDLARLSGTQVEVNWAAATLAREVDESSAEVHNVYQSAFDALVRRNLTVIYPRLWDMDLKDIRALLRGTFKRAGETRISESVLYTPPAATAA
ncbi:MAG: hypothetical protein ACR2O1_06455 [Boseongicola sp.]